MSNPETASTLNVRPFGDKLCAVDGCDLKIFSMGWCSKHYTRHLRHGSTDMPKRPKKPVAERFWPRVIVAGEDECWIWTGMLVGGYGSICDGEGRMIKTHRLSWELANGPIPGGDGPHGTCVCHRCDNPPCCNPSHLFIGSHQDNIADRNAKGRQFSPRGETNVRALLTETDVIEIRARYAKGGVTQKALGIEFGVSSSQVSQIIRRKNWKHV